MLSSWATVLDPHNLAHVKQVDAMQKLGATAGENEIPTDRILHDINVAQVNTPQGLGAQGLMQLRRCHCRPNERRDDDPRGVSLERV